MVDNKPILVTQSSMPTLEEYTDEIRSIFETRWLTNMGVKHQELEKRLVEYLGAPHISLISNGHMSLELTLQAMGLQPGGEVITTPFTFISTTHAIVRNGLTPVFCDIDSETYCIDASKIEALITDKTVAIMPVHVFGNLCDVEAISKIADKYGLKVIYDAAHAFGVRRDDVGVATYGDASIFSFHATKVFNTIEGGAVTFYDEDLGRKLYNLKNFGIRDAEYIEAVGANAKMNEFQAAMGLVNLKHIDEEIEKRKAIFKRYIEYLRGIDGLTLSDTDEKAGAYGQDLKRNYAYFPVVFGPEVVGVTRDEIAAKLGEQKIYPRKYFYPLTNDAQCYIEDFNSKDTPIAKYISDNILTLPMYADLALKDVDRICNEILEVING